MKAARPGNLKYGDHDRISRARKLFFANLLLSICLLAVALFTFTGQSNDAEVIPVNYDPLPEIELNPIERAFLEGEVLGLSQHPDTLPEYHEDWVLRHSASEIRINPHFSSVSAEQHNSLVQAFFDGYTKQFNQYHDTDYARNAGHLYGVKCRPPPPTVQKIYVDPTWLLKQHKAELLEFYNIRSEAEWILFTREFQVGFNQGFNQIVDGVTLDSYYEAPSLLD